MDRSTTFLRYANSEFSSTQVIAFGFQFPRTPPPRPLSPLPPTPPFDRHMVWLVINWISLGIGILKIS